MVMIDFVVGAVEYSYFRVSSSLTEISPSGDNDDNYS